MIPDTVKIIRLAHIQVRHKEGPPSKVCYGVRRAADGAEVFRSVKTQSARSAHPIAFLPTEQEAERLARELNNEVHTPEDDY